MIVKKLPKETKEAKKMREEREARESLVKKLLFGLKRIQLEQK